MMSDPVLGYATAEAHNRMMAAFCSVDRRFLATAYVPLADFERAKATAQGSDRGRREGVDDPLALSEGAFAEPHRVRSDLADGGGGGAADLVSRGR